MTTDHDYELIYVETESKLSVALQIRVCEPPPNSGLITKLEMSRKDGTPVQDTDIKILESLNHRMQSGQTALDPRPRIEFDNLRSQSQMMVAAEIAIAGKHYSDSRLLANEVCRTLEDMGAKDARINNRIARSITDGRSR